MGTKHFQEALKSVRPSCLRSSLGRTELSPISWEQIGGLDEVKLKLRQVNEQQCSKSSHPSLFTVKDRYLSLELMDFIFPPSDY